MRIEGINYEIDWAKFKVGYSFFIPCLDTRSSVKRIRAALKRFRYDFVLRVVIEDGVRGVRVWRV